MRSLQGIAGKFSVPADKRKCPCGRIDRVSRAVVGSWSVGVFLLAGVVVAQAAVPLPRPRPPGLAAQPPGPAAAPAPDDAAAPSACRRALDDTIAIAPAIAPIAGPGECGGEDLVRLEAVVLPDRRRVAVTPAATLRCDIAAEVAAWVREDVAPLVERDGARLEGVENADSFSCRGRNRVKGAKLSEHGRANALDIRALRFAGRPPLQLPARATPRALRAQMLASMCARFTTVLGPGSDGYHEDHIHLDLRRRGNGYRICQWTLEDETPPAPPAALEAGAATAPAASEPEPPRRADASGTSARENEVASLAPPAVPLPRPRPAAAPAAVEPPRPDAEKPDRPKAERKARPRRAAQRAPALPWPFSLLPPP